LNYATPLYRARPMIGAVLLFGLLATSGCQKPEEGLGVDLLPPGDPLEIVEVDTATLVAWTVPENPVRTSNLSRCLLGSYLDDRFGLVSMSLVTQLRLSTNNVVGDGQGNLNLVCDSVVLSLVYDPLGYGYGNLDPQVFKVLELAEYLPNDTVYRSDKVPAVVSWNDLVVAGRDVFTPQPLSEPVIEGVSLRPQLRIPLDPALGQRILGKFGEDETSDNTKFQQFFKGLWVLPDNGTPDPYQAAVLYFAMLDAQTKLTLYYRNTLLPDTLTFDLLINDNGVRFTHARHEPSLAIDQGLPQALADSTLGVQLNYVQSLGGLRTRIRFPYLQKFKDQGYRAIAKAELVVPVDGTHYPAYVPPALIFPVRRGSSGQDLLLPDQNATGIYNSTKKEYTFNVTRWVQGVINGTYTDAELGLIPGSNGVSVNRVVLTGPGHPDRPMKLLLTFTTS